MNKHEEEQPPFESLGLSERMMRAIQGVGFKYATPIQAHFIPVAITGQDAIGQARTGTGKTASFGIPICQQVDPQGRLQAMILTEGEKMLLTPTYHVFGMLKGHQDATRLALDVETDAYSDGETTLPAFSASASRSASGDVLLSLCNLKPDEALTITCDLQDLNVATVEGLVLGGGAMNAHNTFDEPEHVVPTEFAGATLAGQSLTIELPAGAVVALTLS